MTHKCSLPYCDGTRLGHELAKDHPRETAQVDEALDRLRHPDDYVKPENLQVEGVRDYDDEPAIDVRFQRFLDTDRPQPELLRPDPHHWPEATREQIKKEFEAVAPTCEEYARRGTGYGMCGKPLDEKGNCPNWRSHVEE